MRVAYLDSLNYRYADALQSKNEGQFAFNAPRKDICDFEVATTTSVASFYEDKFKALGMRVTREDRGAGYIGVGPLAVVATDAQRSVIIYPNGSSMLSRALVEPPGLGLKINVEYAPCASIVNGEKVVSPKVSDTNMHAAEIPCTVLK